jgi:predicted esterase
MNEMISLNYSQLVCDVIHDNLDNKSSPLFLLLHGYSHNAQVIYDQVLKALPKDSSILAPNGPFPIPLKKKNQDLDQRWFDPNWRLGFAWYFYNFHQDKYFIPTSVPTKYLMNILKHYKISTTRAIHIIGFSQGGYLAGAAAPIIQKQYNLKTLLGIGCRFRPRNIKGKINAKTHLLIGDNDNIIDIESARKDFNDMNFNGVFKVIKNTQHEVNSKVIQNIKKLI